MNPKSSNRLTPEEQEQSWTAAKSAAAQGDIETFQMIAPTCSWAQATDIVENGRTATPFMKGTTFEQRSRGSISIAAKNGHLGLVQHALNLPSINLNDRRWQGSDYYIIKSAVESGLIEMASLLLSLYPKMVHLNPPGLSHQNAHITVLRDALKLTPSKCLPMIALLLSHGADPSSGLNMHEAYTHQSTEAFDLLVAAGGRFDRINQNQDQETNLRLGKAAVFAHAASHGGVGLLWEMLRRGLEVHAVYPELEIPDTYEPVLWVAAEGGNAEVVKALLEAGADSGIRNRNGETALEAARRRGNEEVIRLLE